jgi:hypothetical protein
MSIVSSGMTTFMSTDVDVHVHGRGRSGVDVTFGSESF